MASQTSGRRKRTDYQQSSFRSFILARRFGSWGQRLDAEENGTSLSRFPGSFPSDTSRVSDESDSDEDSLSSRYTDARSTIGSAILCSDGMAVVQEEADSPADAEHEDPRSTHRTDGDGLPRRRPSRSRSAASNRSRGRAQTVFDAAKNPDALPDWSSSRNPWEPIDRDRDEGASRHELSADNARLRAEIMELHAALAQNSRASTTARSPKSPRSPRTRTPSAGPSGRESRKRKERKEADVSQFETTTLRDLVLKRIFTPQVTTRNAQAMKDRDMTANLTLDTPLSGADIQKFTQVMDDMIIAKQNLKQPIAMCAVCHLPKFREANSTEQVSYISGVLSRVSGFESGFDDFHPILGMSRCCRRLICKSCLSTAIVAGIRNQWWLDLPDLDSAWLKCPVPCCRHNLPLHNSEEALGALRELGLEEDSAIACAQQYRHADELRSALQFLNPVPNREAMRRSIVLHRRLARLNKMRPLLESASEGEGTSGAEAVLLKVDTADGRGSTDVPIFTHLLSSRRARDCAICEDTYLEFDRGPLQTWTRTIRGFTGEWAWRILDFPVPEVLPHCDHALDMCRRCLSKYVATAIDTKGHGAVDSIRCPDLGCGHIFTHEEIRALADSRTFAVYDRYTVLNSVSALPNFRWCLGEGCTAGSLYDMDQLAASDHDRMQIVCSECDFAMCFACQTPWHEGLDCDESASQRMHGDPDQSMTRDWLSQHTKACPGDGCGVPVEKGEGCFHMTCSSCQFEFCWECLADWSSILVFETGIHGERVPRFRLEGHREGCYFRTEGAAMPTQVVGVTLEDGLRALRAEAGDQME